MREEEKEVGHSVGVGGVEGIVDMRGLLVRGTFLD